MDYRIIDMDPKLHRRMWEIKVELGTRVELHEVAKKIIEIGLMHHKEHRDLFEKLKEEKEKKR